MTIELYKNSLISFDDAQIYFDERFDSNSWLSLDTSQQELLLISASKKISSLDFVGEKLNINQPLAFPRNYEIPQDIKNAVCEEALAIFLNINNIHSKNKENNISSINLGVGAITYNTNNNCDETETLFSSTARQLVKKWLRKGFCALN
jgi:hypothetical protein